MPNAPAVACRCGALNCEKHSAKANAKQADIFRRDDPLRAIYRTKRWQRTRLFVIGRDPLCVIGKICVEQRGVRMPSSHADHVIAIRDGGDPWDVNNIQGACHGCHTWKTSLENQKRKEVSHGT
jgi:5-methylcytosine-specific restriction enzyme A